MPKSFAALVRTFLHLCLSIFGGMPAYRFGRARRSRDGDFRVSLSFRRPGTSSRAACAPPPPCQRYGRPPPVTPRASLEPGTIRIALEHL